MKKLFRKILLYLSSYNDFQRRLYKWTTYFQQLMGIGVGASVESSGEITITKKLLQQYDLNHQPLVIFDVGTNKGQFIDLLLSNLDIPELNIHSFEPSSTNFNFLLKKYSANKNIKLNKLGLGQKIGEFDLFYDKPGSGLASLTKRKLDHFNIHMNSSERIKVNTLDNYCQRNNIESIDLLKIDVEGHELDVLKGGHNSFRKKIVRMVSFEFGGTQIDTRTFFQDFYYFFKQNGMKAIYRITPSGLLLHIPSYREEDEQFRAMNYFVTF